MGGNIQQGIYTVASGGQFLERANLGWPDPDPKQVMQALRKAVAEYQGLGATRRLTKSLDAAKDKLRWEQDAFVKPKGTLDLRISNRGYAFPGMTSFDQRHPMYYHLDRLWFKPSEWQAWLPREWKPGSKVKVTGPLKDRIVMLSHMQGGSSAWWQEHIRGGSMTSEVLSVKGDQISIRITADYDMKADSQWCSDTYRGDLLAYGTYDRSLDRFTSFELAMLGTHTVGKMMENIHVGSPTQKVAVYATINPLANASDRMIPTHWKYGYTLGWARTP